MAGPVTWQPIKALTSDQSVRVSFLLITRLHSVHNRPEKSVASSSRPSAHRVPASGSFTFTGLPLSCLKNGSDLVALGVPSGSNRLSVHSSVLWPLIYTFCPRLTGCQVSCTWSLLVCSSGPVVLKVGPWTAASASPGSLLEILVLAPKSRNDLEILGVEPGTLYF